MNKVTTILILIVAAVTASAAVLEPTGNLISYNGNVTLFAQCCILLGLSNDTAVYRSGAGGFVLVIDYSLYNMTSLDRNITRCFLSVSGLLNFEQLSTNLLQADDTYYCDVEALALGTVDVSWVRYQGSTQNRMTLSGPRLS